MKNIIIILLSIMLLSCHDSIRESNAIRYDGFGYINQDMVVISASKYRTNSINIYEYTITDQSSSKDWTLISSSVFQVGDTIQIVKK